VDTELLLRTGERTGARRSEDSGIHMPTDDEEAIEVSPIPDPANARWTT
jgi:hypothetical protein